MLLFIFEDGISWFSFSSKVWGSKAKCVVWRSEPNVSLLFEVLKPLKQVSHKIFCATGKIITKTSLSRNEKYFLEKMKALLNIFLTKSSSGTTNFVWNLLHSLEMVPRLKSSTIYCFRVLWFVLRYWFHKLLVTFRTWRYQT